jgi:hypothetical protein
MKTPLRTLKTPINKTRQLSTGPRRIEIKGTPTMSTPARRVRIAPSSKPAERSSATPTKQRFDGARAIEKRLNLSDSLDRAAYEEGEDVDLAQYCSTLDISGEEERMGDPVAMTLDRVRRRHLLHRCISNSGRIGPELTYQREMCEEPLFTQRQAVGLHKPRAL